ncbi:ketopantoate reductase family protein [Bifidobacterium sp. ESL0690]|uniref:ketopantoate reductase family protein n=1 Tax=Bifidobacterium sp. ESL0690 TaxID=2983214 RepID=UPI0023F97C5E|nr:ketopantoate reductase family protein [Bifidobacterium sp. ESL0690]WEV46693.1 ketopantoate reductase family protein [Bifidobacterium sp. ESL0690]
MKYGIIGAGAMGFRYGVLLQELAHQPVDYVEIWEPNLKKVKEQGGVYVSRDHENRHLVKADIYSPEEYAAKGGDPDLWIIMVKQMDLDNYLKRCADAGLFKDHQVVFSAMNGWGHFEKILKYFPKDRIYGGTAMVASAFNGPGDVDFIGKPGAGTMHICAMTEEVTPVEKEFVADLDKTGFNPQVTQNFRGTCMAKVIFNSVINSLCTMYQITMGQFVSYSGYKDMATQLINEAYDALERSGFQPIQTRAEAIKEIDYVSRVANPLHYPSMYQDMSKGRKTEVDYINGYIARVGRENDCPCRVQEFLTHGVHVAELAFQVHKKEAAEAAEAAATAK